MYIGHKLGTTLWLLLLHEACTRQCSVLHGDASPWRVPIQVWVSVADSNPYTALQAAARGDRDNSSS
jgi:hypothetical protein